MQRMQRIVGLALILVIGILGGCSARSGDHEDRTASEVAARVAQAVSLGGMQARDAEKLRKLYGIKADDIADFALYTAESNVKADELAIVKVKEPGEADNVMNQIRHRIEAQTVKFRDYRPEEFYLIDKHVLKSAGSFVFFAVSKEADRMEQAFDAALK